MGRRRQRSAPDARCGLQALGLRSVASALANLGRGRPELEWGVEGDPDVVNRERRPRTDWRPTVELRPDSSLEVDGTECCLLTTDDYRAFVLGGAAGAVLVGSPDIRHGACLVAPSRCGNWRSV